MRDFAEIDCPDALIRCDRLRLALGQQLPPNQHRNTASEIEHKVHVVLDQEDRDVGWQSGEGGEDVLPLFLRHAGGGFVQQQHLRARRKREGDLQESLLTVRELPGRLVEVRFEAEAREQAFDFSDNFWPAACNPPEISAGAVALRDRERKRLRGRQIRVS
jgi:hypothetical protein